MSIFRRIFSVKPGHDDHIMTVIGETRIFENLSLADIEKLADQVTVLSYEEGERIFLEGDPGDSLYIIDAGSVEVSVSDNGQRRSLAFLHDRDYFGEMALIAEDGRRTASVHATKATQCLQLTRGSFEELLASSHVTAARILYQLCRVLSRRLARTSRAD